MQNTTMSFFSGSPSHSTYIYITCNVTLLPEASTMTHSRPQEENTMPRSRARYSCNIDLHTPQKTRRARSQCSRGGPVVGQCQKSDDACGWKWSTTEQGQAKVVLPTLCRRIYIRTAQRAAEMGVGACFAPPDGVATTVCACPQVYYGGSAPPPALSINTRRLLYACRRLRPC